MIEEIITLLRKNTPYKFYYHQADVKNVPCVVYDFQTLYCDGIKCTAKLTLQIMTAKTNENSIKKSLKMCDEINCNIITKGDNSLTNKILTVTQNGGGVIPDKEADILHNILYYDIIYRN